MAKILDPVRNWVRGYRQWKAEREAKRRSAFHAAVRKRTFLPARTYRIGHAPPELGDGFLAINIPERRLWIGSPNGAVEVTSLEQLIDCYLAIIERHKQ